jgi:hypothetical protein
MWDMYIQEDGREEERDKEEGIGKRKGSRGKRIMREGGHTRHDDIKVLLCFYVVTPCSI